MKVKMILIVIGISILSLVLSIISLTENYSDKRYQFVIVQEKNKSILFSATTYKKWVKCWNCKKKFYIYIPKGLKAHIYLRNYTCFACDVKGYVKAY